MMKRVFECDRCLVREEEPAPDRNWSTITIHLSRIPPQGNELSDSMSMLCPDCTEHHKAFLKNRDVSRNNG